VVLLAGPDAAQHGVNIQREVSSQALPVRVDADFMKQAILNVVLNGVQAMPEGGTLSIGLRRKGDEVITEIRDQGAGIPPEVQDKIFELYFTTKTGGSGIGLAQTYQILQWHYGSIDFESKEGEGATFCLRLPVAEVRSEALKEAATRS
jgi:signal transduction histidine kinase